MRKINKVKDLIVFALILWQLVLSGCHTSFSGKLQLKRIDSCRVQEDSLSTILQKPSDYKLLNDTILLCVINRSQLIEYNIRTGKVVKKFDNSCFNEKELFEKYQTITNSYTNPKLRYIYLSYAEARAKEADHPIYTITRSFNMDKKKNIYLAINFLEMHYFPVDSSDTLPPFHGTSGGWHWTMVKLDSNLNILKWYNISTIPVVNTDGAALNIFLDDGFIVNKDTLYTEVISLNPNIWQKPVMVGKFVFTDTTCVLKDTIKVPYNPEFLKNGVQAIGDYLTYYTFHNTDFFVCNGKHIYNLKNATMYADTIAQAKDSNNVADYAWSKKFDNVFYYTTWVNRLPILGGNAFRVSAYDLNSGKLLSENEFPSHSSYTNLAGDDKVVSFTRTGDYYYIKTYEFTQEK